RHGHRAAGGFHRGAGAGGNAIDREGGLGRERALAEQADAVLAAAAEAGGLERSVVNRGVHVELAGVDRLWTRPRFTSAKSFAKMLLKPRFGMRMWSGIWPPSNPFTETPERALAPFWPRPAVLPLPEPMPRPTRMRPLRAPELSRMSLSFMSCTRFRFC